MEFLKLSGVVLAILGSIGYIIYILVNTLGKWHYISAITFHDVTKVTLANNIVLYTIKCVRWGMPNFTFEVFTFEAFREEDSDSWGNISGPYYHAETGRKLDLENAFNKYYLIEENQRRIKELEDAKIEALMKGVE